MHELGWLIQFCYARVVINKPKWERAIAKATEIEIWREPEVPYVLMIALHWWGPSPSWALPSAKLQRWTVNVAIGWSELRQLRFCPLRVSAVNANR